MAKTSKFSIGRDVIYEKRNRINSKLQNRNLSSHQVVKIKQSEKARSKRLFALRCAVASLGIVGFLSATKALPEASSKVSKSDSAITLEENINRKKITSRDSFTESLKWEPIPEDDPTWKAYKESQKKVIEPAQPQVQPEIDEGVQNWMSDNIIKEILEAYKENYGVDIHFENVKYLQTVAHDYFTYATGNGYYIYDDMKTNLSPTVKDLGSICSLIDGNGHVFYSIGKFTDIDKNETIYTDVYANKVIAEDGTKYDNVNTDKKTSLNSNNININDLSFMSVNMNQFKGDKSIHQVIFEACENATARAEKAKNNLKDSNEIDR